MDYQALEERLQGADDEGMTLSVVIGVAMIVLAWPFASWGLSVYWFHWESAGRVRNASHAKRENVAVALLFALVGAIALYLGVASP